MKAIKTTQLNDYFHVETPFAEYAWDMARGGILVYVKELHSDAVLIDARKGGPAPDMVISID